MWHKNALINILSLSDNMDVVFSVSMMKVHMFLVIYIYHALLVLVIV
jgi:hypothetical protein